MRYCFHGKIIGLSKRFHIGYYHLPIAVVFVQLSDDSANDVQSDERRYNNDRFDHGLSHCGQERSRYLLSFRDNASQMPEIISDLAMFMTSLFLCYLEARRFHTRWHQRRR